MVENLRMFVLFLRLIEGKFDKIAGDYAPSEMISTQSIAMSKFYVVENTAFFG